MLKRLTAFTVVLSSLVMAVQPAFSIGTEGIETGCLWIGENGEVLHQGCTVSGDSSAGSGTFFRIEWMDGTKTVIHSAPNSLGFITPESKHKVQIQGKFEFSRMIFPRQIRIENMGTVFIQYDSYAKSTVYCEYDRATLARSLDSTFNSIKIARNAAERALPTMQAYTAVIAHQYMCVRHQNEFLDALEFLQDRYPKQVQVVRDLILKIERSKPSED
jgi:hypothetical protein